MIDSRDVVVGNDGDDDHMCWKQRHRVN